MSQRRENLFRSQFIDGAQEKKDDRRRAAIVFLLYAAKVAGGAFQSAE